MNHRRAGCSETGLSGSAGDRAEKDLTTRYLAARSTQFPASIARRLAAAGVWEWVGTDPATGQLLDYGLTKYRPPQALIDFVILRDRTCRSPGCHRPAVRCDIDHLVPHGDGGPTSACNCQPLCKTHHLLKHHGGWKLHRLPSGATVWVSPTGHRYLKPPEQVGPIAKAPPPEPDDDIPPF